MEPIQEKGNTISRINFIVVFISICLVVGAVFLYNYLKQEGFLGDYIAGEPVSEPLTQEQREDIVGSLKSSSKIDTKTMNNRLDSVSKLDIKITETQVQKALDSLE